MAETCKICGGKIEKNEIGKINGTIVKFVSGKKTEFYYLCSSCQKQGKGKKEIEL